MQISRSIKKFLNKRFKLNDFKKKTQKFKIVREKIIFDEFKIPVVTIIIPFYNQEKFTWNCLSYLNKNLSNKYPYEIILIDDNSPEVCDFSLIEGIKIIKNTTNLGFLKNINKGITAAKGEYIFILNNDTEVQKYFLEELFFVFENFKDVGAVGSKLLNPDNTLQEAGSFFLKDFNIHQVTRNKKPYDPEVNYIYKVDYCSGCSLLFKKLDDNNNLNLLDEQFFPAYFEETDLCFNLKYIQKKEIYYTPFSEVVHYNGITYNSSENNDLLKSEKKEALFRVNLEKFKAKWNNQLEVIKATTIEDRIQEKYDNKSIVFFTEMIIPEDYKDYNRLKDIMLSFLELNFHVTLICQYKEKSNDYIPFYERLGINVFYEQKKHPNFEKYLTDQKINASIAWFYGPKSFIASYKAAKKTFPKAKLVYDMVDIYHLRHKKGMEVEPTRLSHRNRYYKYKKIELISSELSDYIIVPESEKEYMKSLCNQNKLVTISNIHSISIDKSED